MLTKRHFQELANALARNKPDLDNPLAHSEGLMLELIAEKTLWDRIVSDIADICEESNPRFDRKKFLKACGVD